MFSFATPSRAITSAAGKGAKRPGVAPETELFIGELPLRGRYRKPLRSEGAAQEKREIAKNFKDSGIPIDVIAKNTGLTLEEIEAL